jgi:hypothetical protein
MMLFIEELLVWLQFKFGHNFNLDPSSEYE